MAQLISGKEVAASVYEALTGRIQALKARGVTPSLTVILVGENPASQVYVRNKARMCKKLGMGSSVIRLDESTREENLIQIIRQLNDDASVHGILVQMPLPRHIREFAVLDAIDPKKDVDGFHAVNAGLLMSGREGFRACTPKGVMRMLKSCGVLLAGANAVVIGRSNIVGKPMAMMLLEENCTVTVCHSRTRDLEKICAEADILVAAVGRPRFVTAQMVKPGAVVIDVGINRGADGKLHGDVDFAAAAEKAAYITPVPGGVGPMTRAMLMKNTTQAAARQNGLA